MARKALLIGVDNYPGKWALPSCVNDCDKLANILANNINPDGKSESPNFDVIKLTDCRSAEEAEQAIRDVFEFVGQDVSLFYFSGHGYVDANNNGQILFPKNMKSGNTVKGLLMKDIMDIVTLSKVNNKIVILDCCHSGKISNDNIHSNMATLPDGCTILSACHPKQTAKASIFNSEFTYLLIQALSGEAADYLGNITVGGVYSYIDKSMGWYGQRPIFKTNITSFIPLRIVKPAIELATMQEGLLLFGGADESIKLDPSYEYTTYEDQEEALKSNPKVKAFKTLQKLESIGFVVPVDEEHMYWAAMKKKSCRLTKIGQYYWKLENDRRLKKWKK